MKNGKRLTPKQIIWMIENGKPLPKSKTWHKFQEHLKRHPLTTKEYAQTIGIPLPSMKKFISGEYVISQGNRQKIQEYLQLHEKCSMQRCVDKK